MDEMYTYIIPLNEEIYNSVTNRHHVFEFSKNNFFKHQLQRYFPHYDVNKTIFAFQTPKMHADKCSYNFDKIWIIEKFLPVHFVQNYKSFQDLPLFKIEKRTSTITCLDKLSEQKKLEKMFIYKQQLHNRTSLFVYFLQNNYSTEGYEEKMKSIGCKNVMSKRNNCCFENLIFINGYMWAFLNHDNCTNPNLAMLENLIKSWFNNK